VIVVDSLLTTWRRGRHAYRASGPEGWGYLVCTQYHVRSRNQYWCAVAGRAISYTVKLGQWKTFEQARAACEEHAVRSQGVTVEVRS
jgi:hypothetical protein